MKFFSTDTNKDDVFRGDFGIDGRPGFKGRKKLKEKKLSIMFLCEN